MHKALYGKISGRALYFHLLELDTLKSRFNRAKVDVSKMTIARMKRKQLVDALLVSEFGADAIIDYTAQCMEWDKMKKFVEGSE